jgi:hypothetical protein
MPAAAEFQPCIAGHAPCDRYPIDSPGAQRKRRALSGECFEQLEDGFAPSWEERRSPNAFGLLIASDPYKFELRAEIGVTRGGEGEA